jgi:hypothetical protein
VRALRMLCPGLGVGLFIGLVCVVWGVAPALATRNHVFAGSIGSPGSGAGQLSSPESVAVDNSSGPAAGDVYVADTGNARVDQFDSSGHFVRAWGWGVADGKEEFEVCTTTCLKGIQPADPAHSQPGQFDVPQFIAVDGSTGPSEGDVYVADDGTGLVQKFTSMGELVTIWGNNGPLESPNGQLNGSNAMPKPEPYGTVEGPFRAPFNGIAVDSSGNLWVFDRKEFMYEFEQSGAFTTSWYPTIAGHPAGIAIDGLGDLYVDGNYEQIEKFSPLGTELGTDLGVVNLGPQAEDSFGEAPAGLAVNTITNELFIDAGGTQIERVSSCNTESKVCPVAETFSSPQLNGAAGLAVASATEMVYAADPLTGGVYLYSLEPAASPKVENQTVSFVTSGSVTFSAGIDPKGLGSEYHFEYGPTTSYGATAPAPDADVGSDFEVHAVSAHVQNLLANTTYHYRVVAHNSHGTTYGEDQIFLTQITGGELGLADGRMYELVTPAAKNGALIIGPNAGAQGGDGAPDALSGQASADGQAIVNLASNPPEAEPLGNAMETAVLSTRGSAGWSSQVIAPPHNEATFISIGNGGEYRFFAEDLSQGIVAPFGPFYPLASDATESTLYLRTDFSNGNPEEHCHTGCFQPLVTTANTPAGTVFGGALANGACPLIICGPLFVDATPDLSHVIISSAAQLTSASAPEGGEYEWSAGRLQLISAPPQGETGLLRLAGAGVEGVEIPEIIGGTPPLASGEYGARHALSDDGERVILRGNKALYLRDLTTGELVRLDVPEGGPAVSSSPEYMTASTDASRIFFLDNAGLAADSSSNGTDLYEYDLNAPVGQRLTDLTVDQHAGEAADVTTVLGASNDASYVYFVARGALTPNATVQGECVEPGLQLPPESREACNLYLRHDGVTHLVTGGWNAQRSGVQKESSARVSSDGNWFAFMSSRDLTDYDSRDAISGHPDQEVYLYDASASKLICASCNPTGAKPVGAVSSRANLTGGSLPDTWAAANLPPWTSFNTLERRYQPRYLSDAGRLFFDSIDALVPQDANGMEDVYEYEPASVGTCSASSVMFGVRSGGCVSLLSSGASAEESAFVDASETGEDAFFMTSSKLVSQDFDESPDVYDAHECTTTVPCYPVPPVVPPVCSTGDACKAAPTPQPGIFGPAPSATFSGVGNVTPSSPGAVVRLKSLTRAQRLAQALRACRKKGRKQRAVCERTARRRFGAAGKSRASAKRKGGA